MKKINRQYEIRVKQNAVIIYLLASLLCAGMIYYIANLRNTINLQKENIEKNENILNITNSIIDNVNKAQTYANLYTHSANNNNLNNFNITLSRIKSLNDSIVKICDSSYNKNTLDKIISNLQKKEDIIKEINVQFSAFNPYKEIYNIIENYQPKPQNIIIATTIQDTIVYKTERKGFFKRLGEVFAPSKSEDSIVLVSKTIIDTIIEENHEAQELINELQLHTEKGRKDYIRQISKVEAKYNNLILTDQEITQEISDLLIILHKQTLTSVIDEIKKSEELMDRNITLSILIASIALLIILTFIFFIFYDVKKVIIAKKATEEAKKRTEDVMESRHKLLLSVSHDIKSPLSSILGYLELMQIDSDNNEEKRVILSMKNSATHILSLLTNLLNFSRLDQGKESIITSGFNIGELCDELAEMFNPLASNKHLTFIYSKDFDNNIFIESDALKIKQILSNVLSNAIKYTIKGKVCFNASHNENNIIFKISDEGIGIPKDKLDEIFKPFSRIDNNESLIEGNGFGLFVVKGLIDLLNGNIDIKSEEGKGSVFIIQIPVKFVETKESPKETIDLQIFKPGVKSNILVIDDDKTLLTVINAMLEKLDVNCDICHSSLEFDKICDNISHYDIILTDREMGAFSGLDVLKKVKSIDSNKKVILMTARSEYNKGNAIEKGFDNYLKKPFSIKDLAYLLNTDISIEVKNKRESKYHDDFPELCSMFDNDDEAIKNILSTFIETTSDNLVALNNLISTDNFNEAVNLCHKMYPMFIQLNQNETADFLSKMDKLRGHDKSSFPEWKDKSIDFMNKTDDFIYFLGNKYDIV